MRLHRQIALLATAALVLVGCSDDGPADPVPTDTTTDTVTETASATDTATPTPTTGSPTATAAGPMASTQSCEADRFTVSYPEGWQTNDPEVVDQACRVFHPTEIELEPGTELGFQWAAALRVENVAFDRANPTDARGYTLLDQRETTAAGQPAVVVEQRATEEAPLVPSGTRVYRWTVELDADSVLVASTYDAGEVDYELEKQVLDAMMATLEVDSSATALPTEASSTSVQGSGDPVTVTDVRVTTADDRTRVVLPVSDGGRPGWTAEYVDEAVAQGSGDAVEVAGDATLLVTVTNTGPPDQTGAEFTGQDRTQGAGVVTEVVHGAVFEGATQVFVGVEGEQPFALHYAEADREIVLDITGT